MFESVLWDVAVSTAKITDGSEEHATFIFIL
jgi:hypothetical protein